VLNARNLSTPLPSKNDTHTDMTSNAAKEILMKPRMTSLDFGKALAIGIATAVLLSLVMVPAFKMGVSPMPKPLGLAFAQELFGKVSLPVGLSMHLLYVTFWSVVYVALFRDRLTFGTALGLGLFLWLLVLVVFFPFVGWGFFGLAESPMLIVASLLPHLLFALFLWGWCRWLFPPQ
jgi:hypothetical protein